MSKVGDKTGDIKYLKSKYLAMYQAANNVTYLVRNFNKNFSSILESVGLDTATASETGSGLVYFVEKNEGETGNGSYEFYEMYRTNINDLPTEAKLVGANGAFATNKYDIEINEETKTMTIDNTSDGFLKSSHYTYSIDGWIGAYGMYNELSLTFHLSTLAPDFAYEVARHATFDTQLTMGLLQVPVETSEMSFEFDLGEGKKEYKLVKERLAVSLEETDASGAEDSDDEVDSEVDPADTAEAIESIKATKATPTRSFSEIETEIKSQASSGAYTVGSTTYSNSISYAMKEAVYYYGNNPANIASIQNLLITAIKQTYRSDGNNYELGTCNNVGNEGTSKLANRSGPGVFWKGDDFDEIIDNVKKEISIFLEMYEEYSNIGDTTDYYQSNDFVQSIIAGLLLNDNYSAYNSYTTLKVFVTSKVIFSRFSGLAGDLILRFKEWIKTVEVFTKICYKLEDSDGNVYTSWDSNGNGIDEDDFIFTEKGKYRYYGEDDGYFWQHSIPKKLSKAFGIDPDDADVIAEYEFTDVDDLAEHIYQTVRYAQIYNDTASDYKMNIPFIISLDEHWYFKRLDFTNCYIWKNIPETAKVKTVHVPDPENAVVSASSQEKAYKIAMISGSLITYDNIPGYLYQTCDPEKEGAGEYIVSLINGGDYTTRSGTTKSYDGKYYLYDGVNKSEEKKEITFTDRALDAIAMLERIEGRDAQMIVTMFKELLEKFNIKFIETDMTTLTKTLSKTALAAVTTDENDFLTNGYVTTVRSKKDSGGSIVTIGDGGFEKDLNVVMPASGEVTFVSEDSVAIYMKKENVSGATKDITMLISGLKTESLSLNTSYSAGTVLGKTQYQDISIVYRDEFNNIIKNEYTMDGTTYEEKELEEELEQTNTIVIAE